MKAFLVALALVASAFAFYAHIESETTEHGVNFKASEVDERINATVAEVAFSYNTSGYPRVRAGVGASLGGNSTYMSKYEYRGGLLEIMEAVCADNDKGFDEATDLANARHNSIDFRSVDGSIWSDITSSTYEGVNVAETRYPSSQWKILVQLKLAERESNCSISPYLGTLCSPTALRVIVRTQGLSYTKGPASRQVLKFAVDSSQAAVLTSDNTTHTGMISFGSVLSLKWSTNATANGEESSVVVSPLVTDDGTVYPGDNDRKDTETRKVIYVTLPAGQPAAVDWEFDVAIDVARFASPAPRGAMLGTGAAIAAALAALLAL